MRRAQIRARPLDEKTDVDAMPVSAAPLVQLAATTKKNLQHDRKETRNHRNGGERLLLESCLAACMFHEPVLLHGQRTRGDTMVSDWQGPGGRLSPIGARACSGHRHFLWGREGVAHAGCTLRMPSAMPQGPPVSLNQKARAAAAVCVAAGPEAGSKAINAS